MSSWSDTVIWWQVYPLGFVGAETSALPPDSPVQHRLRRLEPLPPYGDLERGFQQEVADPLWFLSRQWQMGEHLAEDAGAPVGVTMAVAHTPIEPVGGMDPSTVPAEAIIEGSAADWWTVGRRIRVGRAIARSLPKAQRAAVAFTTTSPKAAASAKVTLSSPAVREPIFTSWPSSSSLPAIVRPTVPVPRTPNLISEQASPLVRSASALR